MQVEVEEEKRYEKGDKYNGDEIMDEKKGLRELPAAKRPITKNKQVKPNQNLCEGIHAVESGREVPVGIHCYAVSGKGYVGSVELTRSD